MSVWLMKRLFVYMCLLYVVILLGACTNRETKIIDEWLNKVVLIPDDLVYTRYGTDTVEYSTQLSDYTILTYVDTVGCTSCQLQLERWLDWVTLLKEESPYNISFLFNFLPKDEEELCDLLRFYQFDIPVCIDRTDRLNSMNKFPPGGKYHTLLLDNEKRVVLLGNPVNNEQIADLYRQILIPNKKDAHQEVTTTISVPIRKIDLGKVSKDDIQATFSIKNIGSNKLLIQHLNVSCGCTSVDYPRQPILSGDSAVINVKVKKDQVGFFQETIVVYGNMLETPVVLKLSGNVI